MRARKETIAPRYVITAHQGMPGVALSKRGHWGGIRYPDDACAERAAWKDANGKPIEIERERIR